MKNLLIAAFVVFFGWKCYDTLKPLKLNAEMSFEDTRGKVHTLSTSPTSPYLIVPWIDNCPYSARTLDLIENYASNGKINGQTTYALYANQITDDRLKKHDNVKGSSLTHMAAQKDQLMGLELYNGLLRETEFMPGDFYIVGTDGSVKHINAREFPQAEFQQSMQIALGGN